MVSYTGKDCPSKIAPLLIWQQPHIINMLDMVRDCYENDVYIKEKTDKYMRRYWILVKETAEFMEDYLVYDIDTDTFNIEAPVYRYRKDIFQRTQETLCLSLLTLDSVLK